MALKGRMIMNMKLKKLWMNTVLTQFWNVTGIGKE